MPDNLHDPDFLLQSLMDNMPDLIYFKDRQSRFVMMNKAASRWQGFNSPNDVIGTSDFDHYNEEEASRMLAAEQHIIATGEPMEGVEEQQTRKNGEVAWLSTTKMPMKNDRGEIIGTFGVSRDITDHKQAELRAADYDEQIRKIKNQMEEDIRMAGDLQKIFFPRSYPDFRITGKGNACAVEFLHHYRASGIVSGDFCTIRRLSDTEAGIFLCDVMGHGVRAALGTALICAMVEELSALEKNPGNYLGRMNALLLPILRQEDMFLYATACYMVFDVATGTLRLATAGHPVPLHFRGKEHSARWLMDDASLRGPALAVSKSAEYQTFEKKIEPGDAVVMYTDGLYEAESPEGEEFGEDRLLAAAGRLCGMPLDKLFASLIGEVDDFAGTGGFSDDVCLIGFTFNGPMQEE